MRRNKQNFYLLNIETSGDLCAVAIGDSQNLLSKEELYVPNIHSEKLAELTEHCFDKIAFNSHQIDAISFSLGPGSFTGLRIGLSLAKGFAFASDIPLIGIPTMKIMALTFSEDKNIKNNLVTLIDARRNEFYWSSFSWVNGRIIEKISPSINTYENIIQKCEDVDEFVLLKTARPSEIFSGSSLTDKIAEVYPGIEHLHRLAVDEYKLGQFIALEKIEPLYLRAFAGII